MESHKSRPKPPRVKPNTQTRARGARDRRGQAGFPRCTVTGAASGPGGKCQTSKPSAFDMGAKALLFITYAQIKSLTKSPATGCCHSKPNPELVISTSCLPLSSTPAGSSHLWMTTGCVLLGHQKPGPFWGCWGRSYEFGFNELSYFKPTNHSP